MGTVDYSDLDPGIRKTVAWLRAHGFYTTDSGDGFSKPPSVDVLPFPHVAMRIDPPCMIDRSLFLDRILRRLGFQPSTDGTGVSIEASFNPADNIAVIFLRGLDDSMLQGPLNSSKRGDRSSTIP